MPNAAIFKDAPLKYLVKHFRLQDEIKSCLTRTLDVEVYEQKFEKQKPDKTIQCETWFICSLYGNEPRYLPRGCLWNQVSGSERCWGKWFHRPKSKQSLEQSGHLVWRNGKAASVGAEFYKINLNHSQLGIMKIFGSMVTSLKKYFIKWRFLNMEGKHYIFAQCPGYHKYSIIGSYCYILIFYI